MGLVVLDASVVLASLIAADRHYRPVLATLEHHADDELVLPASAFAESSVRAARDGSFDETGSRIAALVDVIQPVDAPVAGRSAHLRGVHPTLRLPDALVLATGDVMDADVVLTCDARWSGWSDRVEVMGGRTAVVTDRLVGLPRQPDGVER